MPKLTETAELLEKLPPDSKQAILGLIDLSVDASTDKILNRLDTLAQSIDARFGVFDSRLKAIEQSVDVRFNAIEQTVKNLDNKIDTKFDALNHKISAIYWFVGLIITLTIAILRYLPPSALH